MADEQLQFHNMQNLSPPHSKFQTTTSILLYLGPLAIIGKGGKKEKKKVNYRFVIYQYILQEYKSPSKPSWKFSMHTEGFWKAFRNEGL